MVQIRQAILTDLNDLTKLTTQLGYPTTAAQINPQLKAILASKNDIIFVAVQDGKIVGWIHAFLAFRLSAETFVEIGGLVVDKHTRGRGIGKQLVQAVEDWTNIKNISNLRVRCNVVRKETHLFYESLAFISKKSQKVFHKSTQ